MTVADSVPIWVSLITTLGGIAVAIIGAVVAVRGSRKTTHALKANMEDRAESEKRREILAQKHADEQQEAFELLSHGVSASCNLSYATAMAIKRSDVIKTNGEVDRALDDYHTYKQKAAHHKDKLFAASAKHE